MKGQSRFPMNQAQENTVAMCETTLAFLDRNSGVWSGTAAFVTAVSDAKAGVKAIRDAAGSQEAPIVGTTDEKGQVRGDLEDRILEIADQLSALASKTANMDLGAKVEMTRSSLDRLQDDNLVQTAQRVSTEATANLDALAVYNVTAADVTALDSARTTFDSLRNAPRTAISERKGTTMTLPEVIRSARSIFRNQIDKLMTKFRKSNPEFYQGYFAARTIVDRRGGQSAPVPAAGPTPPTPPKP